MINITESENNSKEILEKGRMVQVKSFYVSYGSWSGMSDFYDHVDEFNYFLAQLPIEDIIKIESFPNEHRFWVFYKTEEINYIACPLCKERLERVRDENNRAKTKYFICHNCKINFDENKNPLKKED